MKGVLAMGSTRKFGFLVTVAILCCISNFAYATYEFDLGPGDPSGEADNNSGWTRFDLYPWLILNGFVFDIETAPYPLLPFINLSLESPTSSDVLSINAWQWFNSSAYRPIDATYSITDFNINIDVVMEDLWGSGGGFALGSPGIGATVEVGMLPEGNYTVNANIYLTPWGVSEPVLYSALDSISFDVVDGGQTAIPEPATMLLLGMGGLALMRRKRA